MRFVCTCAVSLTELLCIASCASDDSAGISEFTLVERTTTSVSAAVSTNAEPRSTTVAERAPTSDRLDCTDPIQEYETPPLDTVQVIGDVVGLLTSETSTTPLQLGRTVGELRFAKTGLLIRSGAAFEIIVTPTPGRVALVAWGNTGKSEPTERFIVGPCEAEANWVAFPGGYWWYPNLGAST